MLLVRCFVHSLDSYVFRALNLTTRHSLHDSSGSRLDFGGCGSIAGAHSLLPDLVC